MSDCKHDMEMSYDASFEVCAWCGKSELDIVKAESKALREAAQAVVDELQWIDYEGIPRSDYKSVNALAAALTKEEL